MMTTLPEMELPRFSPDRFTAECTGCRRCSPGNTTPQV
jgi:hypothetical protein